MPNENQAEPGKGNPETTFETITRGADGKLYLTIGGGPARALAADQAAAIEAILHGTQVAITTVVHRQVRHTFKASGHCVNISGLHSDVKKD